MIELRWAVREGTTTEAPRLQYRIAVAVDASGAFCPGGWSDWKFVPSDVVLPARKFSAAPTVPEVKS